MYVHVFPHMIHFNIKVMINHKNNYYKTLLTEELTFFLRQHLVFARWCYSIPFIFVNAQQLSLRS